LETFEVLNMKTFSILSLGAGVQSSVLLLLSCLGILPKLDAAIFCDTQWEPAAVYTHLWWLAEQAAAAGIPVLIGSAGDLRADMLRSMVRGTKDKEQRWVSMPLFTKDRETEHGGMIRRQCTQEYKLNVIERIIRRDILGLRKGERGPADVHVQQWIGISLDEKKRMRVSDKRWQTNQYPLIGWPEQTLEKRWTRAMCHQWFAEHYPSQMLPRSACIGCPFHSDEEWREMKEHRPDEFADACDFDYRIRTCGGMRGDVFLHASRIPLADVDFTVSNPTQQNLFATQECLGMCGV
jgi:hypothetical protein